MHTYIGWKQRVFKRCRVHTRQTFKRPDNYNNERVKNNLVKAMYNLTVTTILSAKIKLNLPQCPRYVPSLLFYGMALPAVFVLPAVFARQTFAQEHQDAG